MVIVAFGIVPRDDDRAVLPVRAASNGVDGLGHKRFADLRVGITLVVVIAHEILLNARIGIGRLQIKLILVTALNKVHSAAFGKRLPTDGVKESAQAVELLAHLRVVRNVTEVLRSIVVSHVCRVKTVSVLRPVVHVHMASAVTLLIPAESYRRSATAGDVWNVMANVSQVMNGIAILPRDGFRPALLHRERKRGKSQVQCGLGFFTFVKVMSIDG